ncbi:uncharacterized protein LOC103945526 [Pyrus x bretschneideri]|uniref:uncharacterized protein LOC103945526 n=1 Tax=Pyrus x bretschneideri TaxID=225117 RepID=UPI0005115819|nr:uncharacterized protein LOC103945526 [Pyrus x bretschneideri]
MALRRVVGSSNYIPKFGRLAASNRLFGIGGHERYVFKPTKNRKPEGFDYHMYLGGLGPARFATLEFNKLKITFLLNDASDSSVLDFFGYLIFRGKGGEDAVCVSAGWGKAA